MLTVYVLKNGVGRYNIFFNFYTKLTKASFLCRFRVESVNVFVLPRFDLSTCSSSTNNLTNSHMRKHFPEWVHCQVVWIFCAGQHWNFTGYKKIKQRRISFVLSYLRMILWKISTAISIKHRILATFNKKKSILTACMPLIKTKIM